MSEEGEAAENKSVCLRLFQTHERRREAPTTVDTSDRASHLNLPLDRHRHPHLQAL